MWRIRTVFLAGISVLGVGCVVDAGPGTAHGGYHDPGATTVVVNESGLSVAWDLARIDGTATTCGEADTPTVTLRATPRQGGAVVTSSFACAGGAGTVTGLVPGAYDLALDLQDRGGRIVSTVEHPPVDVLPDTVTQLNESAEIPVQVWDLAWHVGRRPGGELACGDVGAVSVQFTAQRDGEPPVDYLFPCDDYGALTTAIPAGAYQVRLLLLDAGNRPIGDSGFARVGVRSDTQATFDADFDQ